ncbi:MAG TPA: TGS domain-containing protein [Herpetosiphonaceae bacterium]
MQFLDPGLRFAYFTQQERELLEATARLVEKHTKYSQTSLDQITKRVALLEEWQLPAVVLAAAIVEPLLSKIDLKQHKLSAEVLALARRFRELDAFDRHSEDQNRAGRVERLRELLYIGYTNVEAALLCLAAHVVRMRSIGELDRERARLLAEDNEAIFLPLVEMLGIWQLRHELGDPGLEVLDPDNVWETIHKQKSLARPLREQCFEDIHTVLSKELRAAEIEGETRLHPNSAFGLYRRLRHGAALGTIVRDVVIDVLVEQQHDCYLALALIHRHWRPIEGRTVEGGYFRDMIGQPESNGYQALVTTVGYRLHEQPEITVQFRIRTHAMERTNGLGIVGTKFARPQPVSVKNVWWQNEAQIAFVRERPLGSLGATTDELYVFSPAGEVITLPQGSTPIDYAYHIHSEKGKHCLRIWINGQEARYDTRLRNGDLIEIDVDPEYQGPDERWLSVVKTSKARQHVKRGLKHRLATPHEGRARIDRLLEQELGYYGLPDIPPEEVDEALSKAARYLGYANREALYYDLATEKRALGGPPPSPNQIVAHVIAARLADHVVRADEEPLNVARVQFTQCIHGRQQCRVVPGARIVGRIRNAGTKYEHLVVYRADCPNAPPPDQAIPLLWRGDSRPGEAIKVRVKAVDRARLLGDVLDSLYRLYEHNDRLYLLDLLASVDRDRSARIEMTIEAQSREPIGLLDRQFAQLKDRGVINDFTLHTLSPIDKVRLVDRDLLANPYTTKAVQDRRVFKGRDDEIRSIVTRLQGAQNHIVLYGMSRVGKTSLLRYLRDTIGNVANFVPIFIDMQELGDCPESRIWAAIIAAAEQHLPTKAKRTKAGRKRSDHSLQTFRDWWAEAQPLLRGQRLLIMFDEFNIVDEWADAQKAQMFVHRLKHLIERQQDMAFILCVQETLFKAAHADVPVVTRPLVRIGFPLRLDYLDPRAAERLISEPMGEMLRYEEAVVQQILDATAHHPFFLQHLLGRLVEHVNIAERRVVTADDLAEVTDELLRHGGDTLFHDFLREYRRLEANQIVLRCLAEHCKPGDAGVTVSELHALLQQHSAAIGQPELEKVLDSLCDLGIVRRDRRPPFVKHVIRVPLFAQWLRDNRPLI